jgi:Oxidoreductase molybdopterin binding domain
MNNNAFRFGYPGAPALAGIVFLWLGASLAANAETPSPASADKGADQGKLAISINNRSPKAFGSAEIGRLPHISIVVEGQGGRSRKFAGVALCDLLESAGMDLGGEQRPAALTTYLWVEGSDGFRVLFSGAEVHRFIGAGEILLADSEDGQAIPKSDGPYRLVVVSDKVHARWMRQVRALYVIQAAPPPNSPK